MNSEIDTFALAVRGADSFTGLREIALRHFMAQGITGLAYILLAPPGSIDEQGATLIAVHGFPKDLSDRYVTDQLYLDDPIRKHALATLWPFWWSDIYNRPEFSDREREIIATLQDADIGDGVSLPVFGPGNRNGYVALGFGKDPPKLEIPEMARLQWAAQMGHQRYCELLRLIAPDSISLSRRELEILEWIARGKSNSVIAEILGLSTYTVDTYLRRIYLKLGVSDRVTAALRGLSIGMVA